MYVLCSAHILIPLMFFTNRYWKCSCFIQNKNEVLYVFIFITRCFYVNRFFSPETGPPHMVYIKPYLKFTTSKEHFNWYGTLANLYKTGVSQVWYIEKTHNNLLCSSVINLMNFVTTGNYKIIIFEKFLI